jgi:ribonuclease HII
MWTDYLGPGIETVVGVDEAGRGPLAGPLAVGVVTFPRAKTAELEQALADFPIGRDSKKMSAKMRAHWYACLRQLQTDKILDFKVTFVSPKYIDDYGMSAALRYGLAKSLTDLAVEPEFSSLLLDGSLKAAPKFKQQITIIKGDEKEMIIGLASIAAKVCRDFYMTKMAAVYPAYDFAKHKGYGTAAHCEAIRQAGTCPLHRQSFLSRILH